MSDEVSNGGFFQFPLCLLAMPGSFEQAMGRAIDYGIVSFLDKTDIGWRDDRKSRERAYEKAKDVIGFEGGNIETTISRSLEAIEFLESWKVSGRKTCDVRIRTDLAFDARNGEALTEREARVLFGIYSAIGAKEYVKIGWLSIQCRAAGWLRTPPKNVSGLPAGRIYPRGQIERSIDVLLERNLVACVTYNKGERYWSHRNTSEQLWGYVSQRKLKAHQVHQARAARDAAESAKIRQAVAPQKSAPY